jgi:hypothetical protein
MGCLLEDNNNMRRISRHWARMPQRRVRCLLLDLVWAVLLKRSQRFLVHRDRAWMVVCFYVCVCVFMTGLRMYDLVFHDRVFLFLDA